MIGKTVSHYRVVRKLGEGGMGVVYEAEDIRLGRPVALKFLPDHLATDHQALERFRAEARAASALNHPHICTIYDVDEAEGRSFIAMELLDGEPLRARLARPLPLATMLNIGIQLADGLEAAHAKGLVHRDVKPENIFVTGRGAAKLLDFGIAKLATEQASTIAATETRVSTGPVAIGTVAYMSPEQVRAETLDARTDLFSLGVVLYEMATGAQPFRGGTSGAVLSEILTNAPVPPVRLNPDLPAELERIVNKLLEKERDLRYQSARDLRVDLERLRRVTTAPAAEGRRQDAEEASIVVLPFENLSPDPDNAFFADGLTEEIIADLSKVGSLRVISRTSAMLLKGSKKDVPTIARDLNVRYVLEGSVRRMASHLRVTVQLIDGRADSHLWAEKFTGTLDDVFELQETLSRRVVDALRLSLTADERRRFARRAIPNVEALDCYLRARQEMYRLTETSLGQAALLADRALDIVGPNPLLLALRGQIEYLYHDQGIHLDEDTLARARSYADWALELSPDCAAALGVKGMLAVRRGEIASGIISLRTALSLERSGDNAWWLAFVEAESGRMSDAEMHAKAAIALDPLFWGGPWTQAFVALLSGSFEAAGSMIRQAARVAEGAPVVSFFVGLIGTYAGHHEEALAAFAEAAECGAAPARMALMFSAMLRGDTAGVLSHLGDSALRDNARQDKELSWWLAGACAQVGAKDEALAWLENSVRLGFINDHFLARIDPLLVPLRGDPRFVALIDRAREVARTLDVTLSFSSPEGGGHAAR